MSDWLQNLKPGDYVIVHTYRSLGTQPETSTGRVYRVTNTTVVLQAGKDENSPGARYDRTTGTEKTSDVWHKSRIEEATPEAVEKNRQAWRRYNLTTQLKNTDWNSLPIDTLRDISKLVHAAQNGNLNESNHTRS